MSEGRVFIAGTNPADIGTELFREADAEFKRYVVDPPCRYCKHFKPALVHDGIKLCNAPDMFHDFSCYERRG